MASIKKSSFQKKGVTKGNLIKGTKPSIHNSQLLISSGIPSFDGLIGGGIPVGSLVLIHEDEFGIYSKFFLKYFLAEGIVSHHEVYLCSEEFNSEEMVKQLPSPVDDDEDEKSETDYGDKKMTIAWRYENLKTVSSTSGHNYFGHYFDLSRNMEDGMIKNANISYWSRNAETTGESFQDTAYCSLLKSINNKLEEGKYFARQLAPERNIIRIGLHHLNSPLWRYDHEGEPNRSASYFLTFMYSLRALIRNAYATCVLTLPFSKTKSDFVDKCIHLSDIAVQLQSFTGTKCENVSPYKDYHGFFIIQKLAAINSLVAYNPHTTNLAFKLRRKKLVIEEFHLPPELEDSTEREQDDSSVLTCSSARSSKFDF